MINDKKTPCNIDVRTVMMICFSDSQIRQKEAKKIKESMMRDPAVDKKLAMKERLPDLCRILKAYPYLI